GDVLALMGTNVRDIRPIHGKTSPVGLLKFSMGASIVLRWRATRACRVTAGVSVARSYVGATPREPNPPLVESNHPGQSAWLRFGDSGPAVLRPNVRRDRGRGWRGGRRVRARPAAVRPSDGSPDRASRSPPGAADWRGNYRDWISRMRSCPDLPTTVGVPICRRDRLGHRANS